MDLITVRFISTYGTGNKQYNIWKFRLFGNQWVLNDNDDVGYERIRFPIMYKYYIYNPDAVVEYKLSGLWSY